MASLSNLCHHLPNILTNITLCVPPDPLQVWFVGPLSDCLWVEVDPRMPTHVPDRTHTAVQMQTHTFVLEAHHSTVCGFLPNHTHKGAVESKPRGADKSVLRTPRRTKW